MRSILEPDRSQAFVFRNKSYQGGPALKIKPARVKEFTGSKTFDAKTWTGNDRAAKVKPFSESGRTVPDEAAKIDSGRTIPNADHPAEVKAFATRAAQAGSTTYTPPSSESVPSRSYSDATRPYLQRGKSQDDLDRARAAEHTLSIDEVRELLNRNK